MTLVGYSLFGAAAIALIYFIFALSKSNAIGASALLWAIIFSTSGLIWGQADTAVELLGGTVGQLTIWIVAIGLILTFFIAAEGIIEHKRAWKKLRSTPHSIGEHSLSWPGLDDSCSALGLVMLLAVFTQLSMVMKCCWAGERITAILLGASSMTTGVALLRLVTRRWSIALADIGLALLSIGIATLFLIVLPTSDELLEVRMLPRYNTILIGLTVMIWVWEWLYGVWEQQLDGGVPWTTTGRMRSRLPRMNVALALVAMICAGMMSVWPRLRLIGGHDATFMRIAFGVIGHLFLTLTLIRLARRWKHPQLGVLAGLTAISLCAFLVIRLSVFSEIET